MHKINDDFEIDHDGTCWLLYEWYDGNKKVDGELVPERKRKGPSYYSALTHVLSAVVDRSAGRACREARDMIEAIKTSKMDFIRMVHGGGAKCS